MFDLLLLYIYTALYQVLHQNLIVFISFVYANYKYHAFKVYKKPLQALPKAVSLNFQFVLTN